MRALIVEQQVINDNDDCDSDGFEWVVSGGLQGDGCWLVNSDLVAVLRD